ncbi:MAG: 1-acyl-sn-glycerol-3-phosphate acyltransferase, partial [Myxococcota bacterium]
MPRKTEIEVEGLDNLPDRSVVLAMNHTDRYNYWPFQYQMYRFGVPRFTATWVKGKYYENAMMSWFMMSMNTIPVPSRGYIIAARFQEAIGRAPSNDEYRLLRDLVDGARAPMAGRTRLLPFRKRRRSGRDQRSTRRRSHRDFEPRPPSREAIDTRRCSALDRSLPGNAP